MRKNYKNIIEQSDLPTIMRDLEKLEFVKEVHTYYADSKGEDF